MRQGIRRQALREATRDIHACLDAVIGEFGDLPAYETYLRSTIQFRTAIEQALVAAHWSDDLTWRPVFVGASALSDAADLEIELLRGQASIASPRDLSALLGMLYVVEGSSLGAKVLRRRAARLGLRDDFGARHLAVMAEGSGWRRLTVLLEETEEFDLASAVASASATFAAALVCFEGETRVAA